MVLAAFRAAREQARRLFAQQGSSHHSNIPWGPFPALLMAQNLLLFMSHLI